MKTGIELITEERVEQVEKHGRTIELDVELNTHNQLGYAACLLSTPDTFGRMTVDAPEGWNIGIFIRMMNKPYRERLVIAGALIAAELDRLYYPDVIMSMFVHNEVINPCVCGSSKTPDLDSDDMVPTWGVKCHECKQFHHDRDWSYDGAILEWNKHNQIK